MPSPAALVKSLSPESDPNEFMITAAKHRLDWLESARPNQVPPSGSWQTWVGMGGRGFGKTRMGAEQAFWDGVTIKDARISIIAPTHGDVRDTCMEGESGLLSIIPHSLIARAGYVRTLAELTLRNGAHYKGFSATEPDRLRGPQFHRAWFDEFAACDSNFVGCAEEVFDMAMFGLRLGDDPRAYITTTPKPIEILRKLRRDPTVVWSEGSTYENRANLPKLFYERITQYEGTRLGEQEIHAKILDQEDVGIIKRSWFKLWPADRKPPHMQFILVSLDTAQTEKTIEKKDRRNKFKADPSAAQVWGLFVDGAGMPQLMILDIDGGHWGMPELIARTRELAQSRWMGRPVDLMLIEDKGSGISLRQMLANEKVETHGYNPGRADKLLRLNLVSHVASKRRIWLMESESKKGHPKSWYEPAIAQICSFIGEGSVRHDDHVDCYSQAIRYFLDTGLLPLHGPTRSEDAIASARAELLMPSVNPYDQ